MDPGQIYADVYQKTTKFVLIQFDWSRLDKPTYICTNYNTKKSKFLTLFQILKFIKATVLKYLNSSLASETTSHNNQFQKGSSVQECPSINDKNERLPTKLV